MQKAGFNIKTWKFTGPHFCGTVMHFMMFPLKIDGVLTAKIRKQKLCYFALGLTLIEKLSWIPSLNECAGWPALY